MNSAGMQSVEELCENWSVFTMGLGAGWLQMHPQNSTRKATAPVCRRFKSDAKMGGCFGGDDDGGLGWLAGWAKWMAHFHMARDVRE